MPDSEVQVVYVFVMMTKYSLLAYKNLFHGTQMDFEGSTTQW